MAPRIYKLNFTTAVRFGSDAGGAGLVGERMTFRADTLFSALFHALMASGDGQAQQLTEAAQQGRFRMSDAMPFRGDVLYFPRPVSQRMEEPTAKPAPKPQKHISYKKMKHLKEKAASAAAAQPVPDMEDPARRKLFKQVQYVTLGEVPAYLRGTAEPNPVSFGESFAETRVNLRDDVQSKPYRVSGFRFAEGCGLYVIVHADDEARALFEEGLTRLSYEGLGGKASSGWGKFAWMASEADEAIKAALDAAEAPVQMLLTTALPADDELDAVIESDVTAYMLVRIRPQRGGTLGAQAHGVAHGAGRDL